MLSQGSFSETSEEQLAFGAFSFSFPSTFYRQKSRDRVAIIRLPCDYSYAWPTLVSDWQNTKYSTAEALVNFNIRKYLIFLRRKQLSQVVGSGKGNASGRLSLTSPLTTTVNLAKMSLRIFGINLTGANSIQMSCLLRFVSNDKFSSVITNFRYRFTSWSLFVSSSSQVFPVVFHLILYNLVLLVDYSIIVSLGNDALIAA